MYLLTCIYLFFFYKYLLIVLIRIEFIIMIILLNIFFIIVIIEVNIIYTIYYLTVIVCEGALGLSLLVIIIRIYGNDYLNSLRLIKW